MSMDGAILPINFYCRNARLCLKKAALSKKSQLYADELQHLKAFETLVLSTIPGHPLYAERKGEKPVLELQLHLQNARKRITEIEESKGLSRHLPGTNVKAHSQSSTGEKNIDNLSSKSQRNCTPSRLQRNDSKTPENTLFRSQANGESIPTRLQKVGQSITPVKAERNPRSRSQRRGTKSEGSTPLKRSTDNTPLKKQRSGSPGTTPGIVSDVRASLANSQNKIRRLQHSQRAASPQEGHQQQEEGNLKMQDTYAFASKPSPPPRSKSTPILQRLRNVSECLGGESPRRTKEKEKLGEKVAPLSTESLPFRPKTPREMPRLKALGLVSSMAGKTSSKATIHLPTRFDSCLSPGNQVGSEDELEFSNTLSSEERLLSPDAVQVTSPGEDEEVMHSSKELPKAGNFSRRTSPGRYPSHNLVDKRDGKDESPELSFGAVASQDACSKERGGNGAESIRREEAAWTTFKLQEQFGEALKELGSLEDRDGAAGLEVTEKCILHASYEHNGPLQSRHGGKGDKMQMWKLEGHVKGERLHEIEEEEAYVQRGGGGFTDGTGHGESARNSPVRTSRKKTGKLKETNNGDGKVHYGEDADHLELFTAPHSKDGSDNSGRKDNLRIVKEDCERFREKIKVLKESRTRALSLTIDSQRRTPPRFEDQRGPGISRDGIRSKARSSRNSRRGGGHDRGEGARDYHDESEGSDVDGQCHLLGNRSPLRGTKQQFHHESTRGEERGNSKNKNKAKNTSALPTSPFSLSSASSSSSSSSSSSLSSLPLSHYIQKLKHLAPESKFPPSPARGLFPGNNYTCKEQPSPKLPHSSPPRRHHHHEPDSSKTLDSADSGGGSDVYLGVSQAAILLPKSPPTSQATLSARIQQRLGNLSKEKHSGSDQRLDAVLGGCALVQSHLQRNQETSEVRDGKERSHHKGGHYKSHKYLVTRGNADGGHDIVSFVSEKPAKKQNDLFDGSMASIQRLVGELKGSVEGFKIRIEVESEGWRGRVEGLEKEIEALKDETEDGLLELKKSIRNEVKVQVSELAADAELVRKDEKDQMEGIVQQKIEGHLSGNQLAMSDLKKEIRSLWAEVETLTKGRQEMQSHMERLNQTSEESRESINREIRNLKKEIHGADERNVWRKETEAERTERAEVRHALEKIKDEGLDMKMEVNGLKKAEKLVKTDLENIRKLIEKLQGDMEEMDRDRGAAQVEGVRERLLIMERVESLSQLYLGGLEEVRTDVYNVKFSWRDRMDELESQWGEYKRQQENGSEDDHSGLQKQRLLNEMELFRSEIADMMETERGLLRETLEREHECIRRQMIDISSSNKNDLTCMMKLEIQKRVQAAKDKVTTAADPINKDMDRLRMDLEEVQQGTEAVAQALTMVEKERDIATQAAAGATAAAEKAREVLADLLGPVNQEIAATRRKSLALQDTLSADKDAVNQTFAEAKKMRLEFQEFMEQEKIRLKTAISLVHKERDAAATAALDASTSSLKAGEVLAEVLGSFNQEMSKARRKSYQLQESLDRERENLERDREEVIQKSQESQEKFNEELERAITAWKRAMNQEVVKAKGVAESMEEDRRRSAVSMEQSNGHAMIDRAHMAKTQEVLANLKTTVKQLQETTAVDQDEKQRRRTLKLGKEQDQRIEISSLKHRMDEAIERQEDFRDIVSESAKRIKKLEMLHMDLAQSFQEVRQTTGDLEKTAAIWLPKYENAARILNEINSKVETLEESCKGISADEGLMQQMAHVAESKVQSLKDIVGAGTELKDLLQKVESGDQAQRQALSMLETRLNQFETSMGPEIRELSVKLQYMEKKSDNEGAIPQNMIEAVDSLQRKVEILAAQGQHDREHESTVDISNKISGLESRIELVASATFTNLRLLDSKVEECSTNAQQALEGAATAENKCSALGTELVKVFRMLASSRQASPAVAQRTKSPPSCGRDHSPTKTNPVDHSPSPPRTRSPLNRRLPTPRSTVKRGQQKPRNEPRSEPRTADFARSTMASEMRKVTPRIETELPDYVGADASSPARDGSAARDHNTQALMVHQDQPSDKAAQGFISERITTVQEGDIKGLGRLTISQDQADDKQKEGNNNCQRTNIRLEAGRIHVNVSHRSGVSTGNRDKRADLVAVQT